MIALLVQDVSGYSAPQAGIAFIPFAIAFGVGTVLAARLAVLIAPRWLVIGGGVLVLGAMLYGSTLTRNIRISQTFSLPWSSAAWGSA